MEQRREIQQTHFTWERKHHKCEVESACLHAPRRPSSCTGSGKHLVAPIAVHPRSFLAFEVTSWMEVRWGRHRSYPPSHRPRTGSGGLTRTESATHRSPRRSHGHIHVRAVDVSTPASLLCIMWERAGCGSMLVAPVIWLSPNRSHEPGKNTCLMAGCLG